MKVFNCIKNWCKKNNINHQCFEDVSSTNDVAKELASEFNDDFLLLFTDQQKHGRGRGENTWTNPSSGEAMLTSWVFKSVNPIQPVTTARLGLGLYKACQKCWPKLEWSLKAPNDLLSRGKKVGGILTEAIQQGDRHVVVVGLGLNVLGHPESLENASSLSAHEDFRFDSKDLENFLSSLKELWSQVIAKSMESELNSNESAELLNVLNKNPNLTDKIIEITPEGDLISPSSKISWKDL